MFATDASVLAARFSHNMKSPDFPSQRNRKKMFPREQTLGKTHIHLFIMPVSLIQDLLIHIQDVSHPNHHQQCLNVQQTLSQLKLPPPLLDNAVQVWNKIDLVFVSDFSIDLLDYTDRCTDVLCRLEKVGELYGLICWAN